MRVLRIIEEHVRRVSVVALNFSGDRDVALNFHAWP